MNKTSLIPETTFAAWFIDEIPLYFGNNAKDFDPKRGITIYGPADWTSVESPSNIKVGIIGTGVGIHQVKQLLKTMEHEIKNDAKQPFIRPKFSGLLDTFRTKFKFDQKWEQVISSQEVNDIIRNPAFDLRVKSAVEVYVKKISNINDMTLRPDIIMCHQTESLEKSIGAATSATDKQSARLSSADKGYYANIKKKVESHNILFPLDDDTKSILDMLIPNDFRELLKAKCLEFDIPTQIITHSVINDVLKTPEDTKYRNADKDPATIAWNLAVALYYKSGHFPWKISNLRSGTCYVGISFYRDKTKSDHNIQTSLAQIFTDTGEGLIMRGQKFKWDTSKGKTVHLDEESALSLLTSAISVYKNHKGQLPERLVIHKSSIYSSEELNGFDKARKEIPLYDYVALRKNQKISLYRSGEHAVLRGTVLELDSNNFLVFTKGHVPYLRSYTGLRTPTPLHISEHYGDSTPEEIIREILALTRLNWNTTNFSAYWPMTLHFSRAVGNILSRVPEKTRIQTQYRFYM